MCVCEAKYVIHILVAASQEYVNTYSTRRPRTVLHAHFDPARARLAQPAVGANPLRLYPSSTVT